MSNSPCSDLMLNENLRRQSLQQQATEEVLRLFLNPAGMDAQEQSLGLVQFLLSEQNIHGIEVNTTDHIVQSLKSTYKPANRRIQFIKRNKIRLFMQLI